MSAHAVSPSAGLLLKIDVNERLAGRAVPKKNPRYGECSGGHGNI